MPLSRRISKRTRTDRQCKALVRMSWFFRWFARVFELFSVALVRLQGVNSFSRREGATMTLSNNSFSERGRRAEFQREEPDYVRTRSDDGRKYVEPNEFIKDPRVREQIRRLARETNGR